MTIILLIEHSAYLRFKLCLCRELPKKRKHYLPVIQMYCQMQLQGNCMMSLEQRECSYTRAPLQGQGTLTDFGVNSSPSNEKINEPRPEMLLG